MEARTSRSVMAPARKPPASPRFSRVMTARARSLHSVDAFALRRLAAVRSAGPTAQAATTPWRRRAARR